MTSAKLQTAVLGATGYAGFELVRLMLRHPRLAPFFSSLPTCWRFPKKWVTQFGNLAAQRFVALTPSFAAGAIAV